MEERTLLLSQSYEPIAAISWQRAIVLSVLEKVEVLEEYDMPVRSPKTTINRPAVVRLVKAFKRHRRRMKFSKQHVFARDRWKCQYCLAPEHLVLTRNFQWIPLGELSVGVELVAFSELPVPNRRGRRYCESVVLHHEFAHEPVFRVVLDDGTEFQATGEHEWLGKTCQDSRQKWFPTINLNNRLLPRLFVPWNRDSSYDARWMAGLLDGEGWVRNRDGIEVALAQNLGIVYDKILRLLGDWDISCNVSPVERGKPCQRILVSGGMEAQVRALGIFGSQRLIEAANPVFFGQVKSGNYSRVVAVENIGYRDIVKMRTSSGTFIADGFPHHNCGRRKNISELTYDHVTPRSRGGKTCWENIITACRACNGKKANRTPEEARMFPKHPPRRPDWVPSFSMRVTRTSMPEEWKAYCYWSK